MSSERLKKRVYSYLDDFPKSTVNDLARIFCRRGCKRSDLVALLVEWKAETREQTSFLEEVPKEKQVIQENQTVPVSYKKPVQKRVCSHCGQKYTRDDYKQKEVCPHCMLPKTTKIGFYGSDFCRMCIPARTPRERFLRRSSGKITLLMEAGRAPKIENGKVLQDEHGTVYEEVPLPAGIIPRLILLYISNQYMKTKSRNISFGNSLYEFLKRAGIKKGGDTYKRVTEQLRRLLRCKIGFYQKTEKGGREVSPKALTEEIHLWWEIEEEEKNFTPSKIILSDALVEIVRTSVPLDLYVVYSLGANVLAFDIYAWLTARHYNLTSPTTVSWKDLHEQFGSNYKVLRQFKPEFKKAFELVKTYYPHNSNLVQNAVRLLPSRTDIDPSILSENKNIYLQEFLKLGT